MEMNHTQLTQYRAGIIRMINQAERVRARAAKGSHLACYHTARIGYLLDALAECERDIDRATPTSLEQAQYEHDMRRVGE